MKKTTSAIIVIILAYILAFFNEGKPKGYSLIPFDFDNIFSQKFSTQSINNYLQKGIKEFNDSNYSEAKKYFKKILKKDKNNLLAKYWLGKTYFQQESYDNAENIFNEVVSQTDSLDTAFYYLAYCQNHNDDIDGAYYNITEFLDKKPQSSEGFDLFAEINFNLTNSPDSSILYEKKAIYFDSSNTDAYLYLDYLYAEKAKTFFVDDSIFKYYQLAIDILKKDIQKNNVTGLVFSDIGINYFNIKEYDSAIFYIKKSYELSTQYDSTSLNRILAQSYYETQQYQKAISILKAMPNLYKTAEDYELEAKCYVKTKSYKLASENYYNAFNNSEEDYKAENYLLLAAKYIEKTDKNIAAEYLKKYIDSYQDEFQREDSVLNVLKNLGVEYTPKVDSDAYTPDTNRNVYTPNTNNDFDKNSTTNTNTQTNTTNDSDKDAEK